MLETAFNTASDHAERILASWWGFSTFIAVALLCAALWGWDGIDRWLTITGTLLVMLLINQSRRSDTAMHIKLDAIDPSPEHNELEKHTQSEIEQSREQ